MESITSPRDATLNDTNELSESACVPTSSSSSMSIHDPLTELSTQDSRVGWPSQYRRLSCNLHGWFRPGNQTMINRLLQKNAKCVIELGAWLGRSTKYLCERCPDALIFSVDLWSNEYFEGDNHYNKSDPDFAKILQNTSIFEQFLSNLADHQVQLQSNGERKGLIPMKMKSSEALPILHQLGIKPDFIYIDASHHYDYVVDDVKKCLDFFPEAILVGDDWDNRDVRRAVEDVAKERNQEIHVQSHTCWTYSRKKVMQILAEEEKQEAAKRREEELVQQLRSKRGFDIESVKGLLKRPKK
jgi:hypothetical protein